MEGQLHFLTTSALRKEPTAPTGKAGWSNGQRKNPAVEPHGTVTVLTAILVADKEETNKVLVESNLWGGMVQRVFLTISISTAAYVRILWNRKSLSTGNLKSLFPLQFNLTTCYRRVSKCQPSASKTACTFQKCCQHTLETVP
jgi:hypothetical protein